ncbi:hypothetical protein [Nannocystis bainbridge]|uniref:Lipoprotein n=1 Tax=Nannocystis bainbridge TaxID=2995303 RepID=A0ABT5E6P0_9BACT|nr:hypothetical protein [Nannocystis bainbridge]MDC0721350.1 hypothetical protein [Nannocystis bainbridge]
MTLSFKLSLAALFVAASVTSACSGGADDSLCAKAAGPLAGIVLLEAKETGDSPEIMKTLKSEVAAECQAQKLEEKHKDVLECYDKNRSAMGYRIFKSCAEEPGKTLIAAVVAKHGGKKPE